LLLAAINWGSVLAAIVGSAVISALVTSSLSARHERQQHLRQEMLNTAATFATDALKALEMLRRLNPMTGDSVRNAQATTGALGGSAVFALLEDEFKSVRAAASALESQRGKIAILFGPASGPHKEALYVIQRIFVAATYAEANLKSTTKSAEVHEVFEESVTLALDLTNAFAEDAWRALRRPLSRNPYQWPPWVPLPRVLKVPDPPRFPDSDL
jgi:hypothetical protein